MQAPVVLRTFLLFAALSAPPAAAGAEPVSQSVAATVTIEPVPEGRRLVRLPTVEFPLRLAPLCAAELAFESLSISVADTKKTYRAADFETAAVIEARLRIPGRQIGPIAVTEFCVGAASASPTTLTIADALTANVSVRCGNESQQSVSYATLPLEVLLVCDLPGESGDGVAAPPAEDQEESPPFKTRF